MHFSKLEEIKSNKFPCDKVNTLTTALKKSPKRLKETAQCSETIS